MNSIGEEVRTKRLQKKVSLRKLAAKTGLATSTIYRVEKGSVSPHSTTVKAINEALETEDTEKNV